MKKCHKGCIVYIVYLMPGEGEKRANLIKKVLFKIFRYHYPCILFVTVKHLIKDNIINLFFKKGHNRYIPAGWGRGKEGKFNQKGECCLKSLDIQEF